MTIPSAISLLELLWMHPVLVQDNLFTRDEVISVNQVKLLFKGQNPRPAKVAEILVLLDALYTAARSPE